MDQKLTHHLGQALGTQQLLLQESGAEWVTHNGHSKHRDLVYRIVTPEAASLALLHSVIRSRKPFQPFLAFQDPLPASFVSSLPWSGRHSGTRVSNELPISMETGKQRQDDGHTAYWLGRGMAQKVDTRCCRAR